MMNNHSEKQSITDCIGQTPLIRLRRVTEKINHAVSAKVEGLNPGHSAKDRTVNFMLNQAVAKGKIRPGYRIVEASSGNTGYSLAMWCARNGYQCTVTVTPKTSREKINMMRALGAEVIPCPSVEAIDPRSYYSVAKRVSNTPNSYYLNQNFDSGNAAAHFETTGPEIWQQTNKEITRFICAAGTCGTLCGTAKYLKSVNPDIEIIGVDAYGSVLKKYFDTGEFDPSVAKKYNVEGLGKAIIPKNFDRTVIDRMIQVNDKESALAARRLAREEGIMAGYSSGAVLAAYDKLKSEFSLDDHIVLLFSDHGSRYLGKIYNDEWMIKNGFIEEPSSQNEAAPQKRSLATV